MGLVISANGDRIMERLSKSNGQIESPVHNKFMIAFWSCCQLERFVLRLSLAV